MSFVIAAPCTKVKDTACVDACPVDCIHPSETGMRESGAVSHRTTRKHRSRRMRRGLPSGGDLPG